VHGAAIHAAGAGAQAARGERGPGGAVQTERPVQPVAHVEPLLTVQGDQRGGDVEREPLDQDSDLRWLAVLIRNRTLCRQLAHAAHAA